MDAENINALATAVIAFVTIIATMVGFYYNLQQVGTRLHNIIILETAFFISVLFIIGWVKQWSK